jgi:acyl-CoA synthetase (AMP-forming)/AMP-acid ligase II
MRAQEQAAFVIVPWTIGDLLRELAGRGAHPAVISFGDDGVVTWGSKAFAENALRLARELREKGVDTGSAVALWAPNSPAWIAMFRARFGSRRRGPM